MAPDNPSESDVEDFVDTRDSTSNGRLRLVGIETLWGDTDGCRVCNRTISPPFQKYCSRFCKHVAEAVQRLYNWSVIRSWVIERDGECVRCGRTPEELSRENALQVDHVQPVSKGGHPFDPRNLQSLCVPCHEHKGLRNQDYRGEDYAEAPDKQRIAETTLEQFTDIEADDSLTGMDQDSSADEDDDDPGL